MIGTLSAKYGSWETMLKVNTRGWVVTEEETRVAYLVMEEKQS